MKTIILFSALVIFLAACSSTKKTTGNERTGTKNPPDKITRTDIFRGGTSFDNAVIIRVEKEGPGIEEEYKWLALNYPGYATIRKSRADKGNKHYDIIVIRTKDGRQRDVYFDITSFFGKL
jgi:ABC-type glycerol-3-phosphate transport system substrate-binding protein